MTQFSLNCNICDLTFNSRPEYLKHRKLVHIDLVPEAKITKEGACQYGDTNCRFKHNIEKEGESIEYNEELFDIVEKVTGRLANLGKFEKFNQV